MLFLKQKSMLSSKYQYGIMKSVSINWSRWHHLDSPCKIGRHSENVEREMFHSLLQLVIIHAVGESDLVQEFEETVCAANLQLFLNQKFES